MRKHMFCIYERDGVFQASVQRVRRFVTIEENVVVGVGTDENEAVEALKAKLEAR